MQLHEFTPHAYLTICNVSGLEIMINVSGDGLYYRFYYGEELESDEIYEAEIVYEETETGEMEAFFYNDETNGHGPQRFSLNNAMRIERYSY